MIYMVCIAQDGKEIKIKGAVKQKGSTLKYKRKVLGQYKDEKDAPRVAIEMQMYSHSHSGEKYVMPSN